MIHLFIKYGARSIGSTRFLLLLGCFFLEIDFIFYFYLCWWNCVGLIFVVIVDILLSTFLFFS